MKLNLLVTSTGGAIAQGIIKSIKMSNLDCNIITTDAQPYAAGLYRGKAAYLVPFAKSDKFIDEIIKISKKENIDGIFIGTDYELLKFAENKEKIEKETNAKVIVSKPEIINIANDKWLTHKFLVENKLPHISSVLYQDVDSLVKEEGFPLIVKPRIGDSSKNTFIVNNKKELDNKLKILINVNDNPHLSEKVDPIIQKYVGDEQQEFTSTTVVLDGRCAGVLSMKREMRFGGHTTKAVVEDFPNIKKEVHKVAEILNPLGPSNFQSRIVNGVSLIFEINCRFSGTTPFCSQIGFNTVEATIRHYILKEKIQNLTYKKGVILRYFNEVFIPEENIKKIQQDKCIQNPVSYINKVF